MSYGGAGMETGGKGNAFEGNAGMVKQKKEENTGERRHRSTATDPFTFEFSGDSLQLTTRIESFTEYE